VVHRRYSATARPASALGERVLLQLVLAPMSRRQFSQHR
jgi:hypothetical protein